MTTANLNTLDVKISFQELVNASKLCMNAIEKPFDVSILIAYIYENYGQYANLSSTDVYEKLENNHTSISHLIQRGLTLKLIREYNQRPEVCLKYLYLNDPIIKPTIHVGGSHNFLSVYLASSSDYRIVERIHVFHDSIPADNCMHTHSLGLTSYVLHGKIVHTVADTASGQEYKVFTANHKGKDKASLIDTNERLSIKNLSSETYREGDSYKLPRNVYHSVSAESGSITFATFFRPEEKIIAKVLLPSSFKDKEIQKDRIENILTYIPIAEKAIEFLTK